MSLGFQDSDLFVLFLFYCSYCRFYRLYYFTVVQVFFLYLLFLSTIFFCLSNWLYFYYFLLFLITLIIFISFSLTFNIINKITVIEILFFELIFSKNQFCLAELAYQILLFCFFSDLLFTSEFDQDIFYCVDYLVHKQKIEKSFFSSIYLYLLNWLIHWFILHKNIKKFLYLSNKFFTTLPEYQQWINKHPANTLPEPKKLLKHILRLQLQISNISIINKLSSSTIVQISVEIILS